MVSLTRPGHWTLRLFHVSRPICAAARPWCPLPLDTSCALPVPSRPSCPRTFAQAVLLPPSLLYPPDVPPLLSLQFGRKPFSGSSLTSAASLLSLDCELPEDGVSPNCHLLPEPRAYFQVSGRCWGLLSLTPCRCSFLCWEHGASVSRVLTG